MSHLLRSLRNLAAVLIALSSLAGGTVLLTSAPAAAGPYCDPYVKYSTPYSGRQVWIPSNLYSTWKRGGQIARQESQGSQTSTTKSRSHSIGVDGSIGGSIGPVELGATVKYNYTYTRSTTTGTSYSSGWSYSFNVPTDTLYRARLYKLGWRYKYKVYHLYDNCTSSTYWRYAFSPVKSNNLSKYYWALEKYSNAGHYRYDGL